MLLPTLFIQYSFTFFLSSINCFKFLFIYLFIIYFLFHLRLHEREDTLSFKKGKGRSGDFDSKA